MKSNQMKEQSMAQLQCSDLQKLLCQFPVIFPGSHVVLISMLHKFCSRTQAAGLKLTLIEKPHPGPTAVREDLGVQKETPVLFVQQICQHLEITGEIENSKIRLIPPRGNIVGL